MKNKALDGLIAQVEDLLKKEMEKVETTKDLLNILNKMKERESK